MYMFLCVCVYVVTVFRSYSVENSQPRLIFQYYNAVQIYFPGKVEKTGKNTAIYGSTHRNTPDAQLRGIDCDKTSTSVGTEQYL
jgi:hypothetical protein